MLEEHTIIKVYGFTHEPYIFPSFLTPRVVGLDFLIHELIVENEHFISFKKASEIKFPWVVGTFIIKNKYGLPIVETMLQNMNFKKAIAANYDPHHVISLRRQLNKNKEFEHHAVEGLADKVIWMDYLTQMKDTKVSH